MGTLLKHFLRLCSYTIFGYGNHKESDIVVKTKENNCFFLENVDDKNYEIFILLKKILKGGGERKRIFKLKHEIVIEVFLSPLSSKSQNHITCERLYLFKEKKI